MSIAPHYLLSGKRAERIKVEVLSAVASWRKVAAKYKIAPSEIERKARAFKI